MGCASNLKKNGQYLKSILKTESSSEIDATLRSIPNTKWISYGENYDGEGNLKDNNIGQANINSSALTSFLELPINGGDAIIDKRIKQKFDPNKESLPKSMSEALLRYFGKDYVDIPLSEIERKKIISDRDSVVDVIFSGSKEETNIAVVDRGTGQRSKDFRNTYVATQNKHKVKKPWEQGMYNQGSLGSMTYTKYKLIVGRYFDDADESFTWTLVRYVDDYSSDTYFPSVEYLTLEDNGSLDVFQTDLKVIEYTSVRKKKIAKDKLESGTLIKLYDYKMGKSADSGITIKFHSELCKLLYKCPVPIKLYEARSDNVPNDAVVWGNSFRFANQADKIEDRESQLFLLKDPTGKFLGEVKVDTVIFKETIVNSQNETKSMPIQYFKDKSIYVSCNVNGQKHATLPKAELYNKPDLDYVRDHLYINIEFSKIPLSARTRIFTSSRENLTEFGINILRKPLNDYLASSQMIADVCSSRADSLAKNLESSEYLTKVHSQIAGQFSEILTIGNVPIINGGLEKGGNLDANTSPHRRNREPIHFLGLVHPTKFELIGKKLDDQGKSYIDWNISENSPERKISFKTDAKCGMIHSNLVDISISSMCVGVPASDLIKVVGDSYKGVFSFTILNNNFNKNSHIQFDVTMKDLGNLNTFTESFYVSFSDIPKVKNKKSCQNDKNKKSNKESDLNLPEIYPIFKDDSDPKRTWGLYPGFNQEEGISDEHDYFHFIKNKDKSVVFVNMDASYLTNFLNKVRANKKDIYLLIWKLRASAIALTLRQPCSEGENPLTPEGRRTSSRAMSRIVLPEADMCAQIVGKGKIKLYD